MIDVFPASKDASGAATGAATGFIGRPASGAVGGLLQNLSRGCLKPSNDLLMEVALEAVFEKTSATLRSVGSEY